MSYGVVYVAHNPRDGENTFKVGKTERIVEDRMKELTASTSNLGTYTALAYFVVNDVDSAEQACHQALSRYRVQDNREFFEVPLPRLIRTVSERVQPYLARSVVPDQKGDGSATPQLSADALLKAAREDQADSDRRSDEALTSSMETVNRWSLLIREKALRAAEELRDEDVLSWHIPLNNDDGQAYNHIDVMCSVTVACRLSKEPLVLWQRGVRGASYSDLDLSRAIGPPKIRPSQGQIEFVEWEEPDDGRIGRIELVGWLDERGETPLPKVMVRAAAIRYDDYRQNFEEKYRTEKTYSDPTEAFEVFLALIVENLKVPQYDVTYANIAENVNVTASRLHEYLIEVSSI